MGLSGILAIKMTDEAPATFMVNFPGFNESRWNPTDLRLRNGAASHFVKRRRVATEQHPQDVAVAA
jgi:hypothetical protein